MLMFHNPASSRQIFVEFYSDNNGRTLKVDPIEEEKFQSLAKAGKVLDKESPEVLRVAAVDRAKARAAEKARVDFGVSRKAMKNLELRTVDIKDLWQVDSALKLCFVLVYYHGR